MAYSDTAEIVARFGNATVRKWADLNNTKIEAEITARVAWALSQAEEDINDMFAFGPYTVPFDEPVPNLIKALTTRWAAWLLYGGRGVADEKGGELRVMTAERDAVKKTIRSIKIGQMKIRGLATSAFTTPEAIADE